MVRNLKQSLFHDPDNFRELTKLGILRYFQCEDDKAILNLRKALRINKSFIPGLVGMGEILRQKDGC